MLGPRDMCERGILIAQRRMNYGYIGDYYVLASKRSQFYYVALNTRVEAFALTKKFLFKTLFKKFPGLHSEMLAESFSRYIREFRKPCGKKRNEMIKKLNKKKQYSSICIDNMQAVNRRNMNANMKALSLKTTSGSRTEEISSKELKKTIDQLEELNGLAAEFHENL